MMRMRFGWWLLVLAVLVAPRVVHAQDLHRWPMALDTDRSPPAPAEPPPVLGWLERWCAEADAPATALPFPLPYKARGQDLGEGYFVPPTPFVGPLSGPRPDGPGFFIGAEFVYFRQTRPILSQSVAYRGFMDTTGVFTGQPGAIVGSGQEALNTNQVQGQGSFQPGMNIFVGYKFENGMSVALEWLHLTESRYSASAGVMPTNLQPGDFGANTFLFAPVTNFPLAYTGNFASALIGGAPAIGATPGIWNAASEMTEQFVQRLEIIQLSCRVPWWETDNYRAYGTFGPRAFIMWEEYSWYTVQRDVVGQAAASTSANYWNITSNRLYGAYCGTGHDWYLWSSPIGGFSFDLQLNGGLYMDFVKGRAGYALGDRSTEATRSTNFLSTVPGFDGKLGFVWYPWEAIQVRLGYTFYGLFNTYSSPRPIDFDMGTVQPQYSAGTWRFIQGLDFGIALKF